METLVLRYQHTCIVVLARWWLCLSRELREDCMSSSDSCSRETSSEDPGEGEFSGSFKKTVIHSLWQNLGFLGMSATFSWIYATLTDISMNLLHSSWKSHWTDHSGCHNPTVFGGSDSQKSKMQLVLKRWACVLQYHIQRRIWLGKSPFSLCKRENSLKKGMSHASSQTMVKTASCRLTRVCQELLVHQRYQVLWTGKSTVWLNRGIFSKIRDG